MASDETIDDCLRIIGEAISLDPEELQGHETWTFLGLGSLLASATVSDINRQDNIHVPDDVFSQYPTVGSLKTFLRGQVNSSSGTAAKVAALTEAANPWKGIPKPKVPLSVVLQGDPKASSSKIFLFPDGSGAGTAYGTLPSVGGNVCLIGLNSPFLRQAQNFTCSIERMARLWLDEIRRLQPQGPYILGGWSAGGYYSFEAAKLLTAAGERIQKLILIDSPCRLDFEALPEQVVTELTRKGLMGGAGEKKAPDWLVQHFTSTVISVDKYMPTPMPMELVPPCVHFIWVKEGLVRDIAESELEVDLNIKVTRFLLEPRGNLRTEGWEKLLPGAQYSFDYMTGNHFQITQPPHSDSLGQLLGKVLQS